MKKLILAVPLLFSLSIATPSWAVDAHHPVEGLDLEKIERSMEQMQETRKRMMDATTAAERQKLMQEHMQHMKEGMGMMGMMMMMDEMDLEKMPMADRMAMMEKRMTMMQEMMESMMMQQETMMQQEMKNQR